MTGKKSLFRKYLAILAVFTILIGLLPINEAQAASARLSAETSRLWLNGPGTLKITLKKHAEGEELTAKAKSSTSVKIEIGEWDGDVCTIKLTPKKTKNTTLTVTAAGETVKVKLYMTKLGTKASEDIYTYARDAVVEIDTRDSVGARYVGTGFFIGDGLVLTNQHIVASAQSIRIADYNDKEYAIKKILAYDEVRDLILFQVEKTNTAALCLADSVRGGERIYSFGNPVCMTCTYVSGVVANPSAEVSGYDYNFIQLAMPSGIGSGGGPILNTKGQLLGIMTLTVTSAQNMSFAVNYDIIGEFLDEMDQKDTSMSLKKLYSMNAGKKKDTNDYDIAGERSDVSNAISYANAFPELDSADIYDLAHDAVVVFYYEREYKDDNGKLVKEDYNLGSGFFINENAVVTNAHVVDLRSQVNLKIKDYNDNRYTISTVNEKSTYDLAVVTVKGSGKHSALKLLSGYLPAVGETVYTFGNPAGYLCTFADGVVAMTTRTFSEETGESMGFAPDLRFINITAPITPGSSGGPLINKFGYVIGVNAVTLNVTEDNNFAIQIDQLSKIE